MHYITAVKALTCRNPVRCHQQLFFCLLFLVPNKVQRVTVNPVQGYPTILSLRWSKPVGECPIDFYTISYQLANAFQCASVAAARNTSGTTMDTMFNITGLLPHSTYYVLVTASTPAGEGSYSFYLGVTAEAGKVSVLGLNSKMFYYS